MLSYRFFCTNIFAARKRSLGQGNIFAPVCHAVHRGGCLVPGGSAPGGVPVPRGLLLGDAWSRGGSTPGGGACSQGVPGLGDLLPGGVPGPGGRGLLRGCLVETPRRVLLRAVRILLECIPVFFLFSINGHYCN